MLKIALRRVPRLSRKQFLTPLLSSCSWLPSAKFVKLGRNRDRRRSPAVRLLSPPLEPPCRLSAAWKFEISIISTFPAGQTLARVNSYSAKGVSNSFRRAVGQQGPSEMPAASPSSARVSWRPSEKFNFPRVGRRNRYQECWG